MGSKGQSMVISSVLLILLVVVVTFIVIGFVVPFVKNQLSGTDCFGVVNEVKVVTSSQYTCYDDESKMNVQIFFGENESLKGFALEVSAAGSSKSYEIKGGAVTGVTMYDGVASLVIPGKNEERTYKITTARPDSVSVYPLLRNGEVCASSDEVNKIISCS